MWDVRPRRLWQQLFNFYRENECPLDNMDNILIDLENCVEAIEKSHDGTVRFLWGCDPGYYFTTWMNEERWEGIGLQTAIDYSSFDWFVLCELTADEAKFTIHERTRHG